MSENPVCIRRLEPEDLPELIELCTEHAAYERQVYDPRGKLEALKTAIFGVSPRLFVWVATDQSSLLGFASLTFDYSTWDAAEFAHLDCLYLRQAARSQGTGAALLKIAFEFACTRGCLNMQWQTPDWNARAIVFYQRFGANFETKQRFFLPIKK
jgi:GNAT superfamily N-acetyltransferase